MRSSKIKLIMLIILITIGAGSTYAQETSYTVGFLVPFGNDIFKAQMAELGYVEGDNITYSVLSLENVEPAQIVEQTNIQTQAMVDAGVDVLVTITDTTALDLLKLTTDIPIVFVVSDDPVATGVVESLVHPGGNATGSVTNRPHERRLQILTEIDPSTEKVYYLYSPLTLEGDDVLQQVQVVAEELGIEIEAAEVPDLESGLEALANIPDDADWVFLTPYVPREPQFSEALITTSIAHQIGVSGFINAPTPGWSMGYGPDINESVKEAARIVDRILRGANPSDLSVETAENSLMVNLEAAEAINLEISESILRQADIIVRPGDLDSTNTGG